MLNKHRKTLYNGYAGLLSNKMALFWTILFISLFSFPPLSFFVLFSVGVNETIKVPKSIYIYEYFTVETYDGLTAVFFIICCFCFFVVVENSRRNFVNFCGFFFREVSEFCRIHLNSFRDDADHPIFNCSFD